MKIIHSRLVIGLVLGVATGLIYGWIISPVEYINTAPDSLRADYRTDYVLMVAQAYAVEDDLERGRPRPGSGTVLRLVRQPGRVHRPLPCLTQKRLQGRLSSVDRLGVRWYGRPCPRPRPAGTLLRPQSRRQPGGPPPATASARAAAARSQRLSPPGIRLE